MPRRKLQFSLLTLFVLITLCAVGMGWWYNQRPTLLSCKAGGGWFLQKTVNNFTYNQGQFTISTFWYKSPRGREHVHYAIVILLPGDTIANRPSESGGSGWSRDYMELDYELSDMDGNFLGLTEAYIDIDLVQRVVNGRNQQLPLETGSVYVLQLGFDDQQTITRDDGTFDDLDITDETRQQLREYYERYLKEMKETPFPEG